MCVCSIITILAADKSSFNETHKNRVKSAHNVEKTRVSASDEVVHLFAGKLNVQPLAHNQMPSIHRLSDRKNLPHQILFYLKAHV